MTSTAYEGRAYPLRLVILFALALAIAVVWLVLPLSPGTQIVLTAVGTIAALAIVAWRSWQLSVARKQNADVLAALGSVTSAIPDGMHLAMPVVLITGDGLAALFDRDGTHHLAWVGDGAIWLRVDEPNALPRIAAAIRQWRDGRSPDGVVVSVVPALHANTDTLTQKLRLVRQAGADASRLLGVRLPGYVAVYQRLTGRGSGNDGTDVEAPSWYGLSSASPLAGIDVFENTIHASEDAVREAVDAHDAARCATRAAGLAALVGWTQRVVLGVLLDDKQPATAWRLYGAGWIDCGPRSAAGSAWDDEIASRTSVTPADAGASPTPWPLPQPLIDAIPERRRSAPRLAATGHALALLACAAALACWGAARNNQALLTKIGADLGRYRMIAPSHDAAKRDALAVLVVDRDRLEGYARNGVPLSLSFGMYHGFALIAPLSDAIASYVAPAPAPAIVTLDGMSLFDSGRAQLKDGSTRAMVGALEMIKANADKRILVAGHTDDVGASESNLKLSVARAGAVRDWLVDASGMPTTRFAIQGYGDTRPIADNSTAEGRARNRRVEITLVPDGAPRVPPDNALQ